MIFYSLYINISNFECFLSLLKLKIIFEMLICSFFKQLWEKKKHIKKILCIYIIITRSTTNNKTIEGMSYRHKQENVVSLFILQLLKYWQCRCKTK